MRINQEFEELWNFCNYSAALDGKHITIICPKTILQIQKYQSAMMMALCDVKYKFFKVNIGGFGSDCDAGLYSKMRYDRELLANKFNLPPVSKLTRSETTFLHYLVENEAFPLSDYLILSYPDKKLTPQQRIISYIDCAEPAEQSRILSDLWYKDGGSLENL